MRRQKQKITKGQPSTSQENVPTIMLQNAEVIGEPSEPHPIHQPPPVEVQESSSSSDEDDQISSGQPHHMQDHETQDPDTQDQDMHARCRNG